MSLILQDNKIIRNISGEIIKTPPIIDISSSYGVTKDGSNLVSKVKNRYNSNVFRQKIGTPSENGDGLRFDVGGEQLEGVPFNYSQNFIMEFWVKFDAATSSQRLFDISNYPTDSSNAFTLVLTANGAYGYSILPTFLLSAQLGVDRGTTLYPTPSNTWVHNLITFQNGVCTTFVDGRICYVKSEISVIGFNPQTFKSHIGMLIGFTSDCLVGNFDELKVRYENSTLIGWDGSALKWSLNEQVFTPPTYPNTLL